ncbi:MAG: hypothetical protein HY290_12080 [Planctomycetia bacterium]|nr:hypothetical protein [Planctomycetia bacterium]
MADQNPKQAFLNSLLKTDPGISEQAFQEYQIMLEQKLSTAEKKFRRRRQWTKWMWIATVAVFIPGFAIATAAPPEIRPFGATFVVVGIVLFYLALLRLIIHVFFERYAFDSARNEYRDAMLLELTRKVDTLATQMARHLPQ